MILLDQINSLPQTVKEKIFTEVEESSDPFPKHHVLLVLASEIVHVEDILSSCSFGNRDHPLAHCTSIRKAFLPK